jgi:hypothetical protein
LQKKLKIELKGQKEEEGEEGKTIEGRERDERRREERG